MGFEVGIEVSCQCGFVGTLTPTQAKAKKEESEPSDSDPESSSDEGPESPGSDSMGTTLELGPRSVEESENGSTEADSDDESRDVDMKKADNEPFRCSQREGGDSWGLCYQDFNRMEKLEKTVVPVEILYSWWVDGKVSKEEFVGTFTDEDVQCPGF